MNCCSPQANPPLPLKRGDTLILDVQVFQSNGVSPQDITGWTMWFTMKYYASDYDAQAIVQLGNVSPLVGIIFTTPTSGNAEVTVPPSATVNFPDGPVNVVFDVQTKDPSTGRVFTVQSGTICVSPDVTRAI